MSRLRDFLRDIISVIPTLLLAITLAFLVIQLIPGDPAVLLLGDYATKEEVANLRHRLGLDRPLYIQYLTYMINVIKGDFGRSLRTDRSVISEIFRVFPYTFFLAISAVTLSAIMGIPLGMISALRRNTIYDHISRLFALLWISMPNFWFGVILLLLFSFYMGWFPMVGAGDLKDPINFLYYLVLPTIALGARHAALVMRITRASILEVSRQDYIQTARAKGLPEWIVNYKHTLRNALLPVITVIALDIGTTLGGTVVIEIVFSRPGLGALIVQSIYARDYPQLQGCILFIAFCFIVINLLTDIIYKSIDPRIELHGRME